LYGLISVGSAFLRTATGGDERKKDGFWIIEVSGIYLFPKNLVSDIVDSVSVANTFEAILLYLGWNSHFISPDGT
jgi:hypothetical protein